MLLAAISVGFAFIRIAYSCEFIDEWEDENADKSTGKEQYYGITVAFLEWFHPNSTNRLRCFQRLVSMTSETDN